MNRVDQLIKSSELAKTLDPDIVSSIAELCEVRDYPSGTKIYESGSEVTFFLVILDGRCRLLGSNGEVTRVIERNDFFGLVSLLSGSSKSYDLISDTEVTVLQLSKSDLDSLSETYPNIKERLMDAINLKLFNPEINSAIKKIAKGIDDDTISKLKENLSWKTLQASEVLFSEGDPGDSCYVVMSGRVQAIKNYGEDSELVLGELSRGDIIGDMALITEEPRSATIKSTKLTRLICFSKDTFNSVMYSNPQALMEVSKALINRLKHKESRDDGQSLVIGVISLIDKVSTDRFLDLFISSLNRHGSIESVDEKISGTGQDLFNFEILIENIIAEKNYLVLRSSDLDNTEWKSKILNYSDKVLVLGNSKELATIGKEESAIFGDYRDIDTDKVSLLINHSGQTGIPSGTAKIKSIRNGVKLYHMKEVDTSSEVDRVVRRITNNTLGLVLGGGGAKGFAHLGLFKAMTELGIPVDVIGGTSAGSIVAAQIALGYSLDEIIEINRSVNRLKMFKEYGFPYISLIKSKKIEQAARLVGSDRDIEDMWIPFFAPATDLTNSRLVLFESGPVWEAIRSSGALPGIVVPHFKDSSILVDGGVLNNLPVDIMRSRYDGKIICSSCSTDQQSPTKLDGVPNQARLFFEKMYNKSAFKDKYSYIPTISELILKMSVVSSSSLSEKNIGLSDLYLELPVERYGLTDFNDKAMNDMIDIAYDYSIKQLQTYKDENSI